MFLSSPFVFAAIMAASSGAAYIGTRSENGRHPRAAGDLVSRTCNLGATVKDTTTFLGYVKPTVNNFGVYGGLQSAQAGAMIVNVTYSAVASTALNLPTLNGVTGYPFFGAVLAAPDKTYYLSTGVNTGAFVGGVPQAAAGPPVNAVGTPTLSNSNFHYLESAIWSYDATSLLLTPKWTNADGNSPPGTYIIWNPADNTMALTGNPNEADGAPPNGVKLVTLTCVAVTPAGSYYSGGASVPCPVGQYQPAAGQTYCLSCPVGHFQSGTGQTFCPATPAGFYNDVSGASAPIPCTAGHFQNLTGQTNCSTTPAGSYNTGTANGSPSPIPCASGTVQPATGQSACVNCAAGQSQNQTGQTTCSATPAGFYNNVAGGPAIPCAAGHFQPLAGQTSCPNVTPAGSYNDGNANGSPSAIPCPAGKYQPATGQNSCLPAPLGFYTKNATGSTTVIACASGQYQNQTGQTSCQTTPVGFFNNGTSAGSPSPIPCPPGSYQSYTGKNFCYGAPKGRFQSMSGQAGVCGTCCGWAAPLVNNNVSPVNCTGSAPNSYPASGDGCISANTGCVHTTTCVQDSVTGACPASTFYG